MKNKVQGKHSRAIYQQGEINIYSEMAEKTLL